MSKAIKENMLLFGGYFFFFEIQYFLIRQILKTQGIKIAKDKSDHLLFIVYSTSQCLLTI